MQKETVGLIFKSNFLYKSYFFLFRQKKKKKNFQLTLFVLVTACEVCFVAQNNQNIGRLWAS